jgi:uncharacterized OsmC-like protein
MAIVPSTKDYEIGGGKVLLADLDLNGKPKGFYPVGNAPEVNISMSSEEYEHFNSTGTLKRKDFTVTTSQGMAGALTLENFIAANLEMFFAGQSVEVTNPATAGVSNETIVEAGDVEVNTFVQLAVGGQEIMNIDPINLSMVIGTVDLVEGTDYNVDAQTGLVNILDSANIQTGIASGVDPIEFTLAPDASAEPIERVTFLKQSSITKAVKIVMNADKAVKGKKQMVINLPNVNISADGDLSLIKTDEVKQMQFKLAINESEFTGEYGNISYQKAI